MRSFFAEAWSKNWKIVAGGALSVALGLLLFGLMLWPVHRTTEILPQYVGIEQDETGVKFGWLKPNALFHLEDVPRYGPIYVHFTVALNRPEGAPPAVLQVIESRDDKGGSERVLATYEGRTTSAGWREYLVKIPPSETSSEDLYLYFRSNEFKVKGDTRALGLAMADISFEVKPAGLLSLLFPRPYLIAVLLLLVGMALWGNLLRFSTLETAGLCATTGFASGILANILAYHSFYLLIIALLFLALPLSSKFKVQNSKFKILPSSVLSPQSSVLLLTGLGLFAAFFVVVPGLPGDIYYWREVIQPIMQYGPIGVYPYAPRLVYPPGSVFFLWGYGLLTQPFGITYNQSALKALMGVSHFGLLGLLWYVGYKSGLPILQRHRALALFGLSLSLVFVPVSWVQADGWLTLMMIVPLVLVVWGRFYASGVVQAVGVLYKAQSWLLLPFYALNFWWKAGWRKSVLVGGLTLLLIGLFGGLGFAFDMNVGKVFWEQPAVSGESAWGGIRSFNLLHLLGYDQKQVPQPLLSISYGLVAVAYLAILLVTWWRNRQIEHLADKAERDGLYLSEWLLAAGLFFTIIFYVWVKMHERYLYFGLAFLPFVALWRRDMYKPIILLNFVFMANLLYAYLPERRDPVPNNFLLWRHALHAEWVQNGLVLVGLAACLWLAFLYFRPPAWSRNNLTAEGAEERRDKEAVKTV